MTEYLHSKVADCQIAPALPGTFRRGVQGGSDAHSRKLPVKAAPAVALLLMALSLPAEAATQPFLPSASHAISLTRNRPTTEFVTVGQMLAYAERVRRGRPATS